MDDPKLTNKRSMKEEDGSYLAMSPLAKRQMTARPPAENTRAITLKKIADPSVTGTPPNGPVTPPQEPDIIDLSLEVAAKPICRPTNEFPRFSDGDVFIDLGSLGPLRYQIHSAVLSRASSWFDETLAQPIKEFDNIVAANHTKRTGIRARYELSFNSDLHMFVLERAALTKVKKPKEVSSTNPAAITNVGRSNSSNDAERRLANVEHSSSNSNANILSSIQELNSNSLSATPTPRPMEVTRAGQTFTSHGPSAMSLLIETQGSDSNPLSLPNLPKVKVQEPAIKQKEDILNSALMSTENSILSCEDQVPQMGSQAATTNLVPNAAEENRAANKRNQAITQEVPVSTKERQVTNDYIQEVTAQENQAIIQEDQATPSNAEVLAAYKSLFRIFYGKPINIDTDDINEALRQVEAVVRVAQLYGSIPVVRLHLANSLSQYGQGLYRAILQDPPRWLQLSLYLECAPIFKEAAVHIIGNLGNWPWSTVQLPDFPKDLVGPDGLFQRKVDKLKTLMADVERTFFMTLINVEGEEGLLTPLDKRTINTWYVVQLWKQWFSQAVAKDEVPKPTKRSDSTKYRMIAKGGDAYLPLNMFINQIKEFREPIRLTEADRQGIEEDLKMIKAFAQKQVGKLCANKSMLSAEEAGVEHLTCLGVDDDDIPWLKEEVSLASDVSEVLKH